MLHVLLVLREKSSDLDFVLRKEVGVMVGMLEEAEFAVVTASASGRPDGTETLIRLFIEAIGGDNVSDVSV